MKLNVKVPAKQPRTAPGAIAARINPELQLRRSVMACMLWEDTFYEEGQDIATRIVELIPEVKAEKVAEIAAEAREVMKLRHVPLLIVREMARLESHKHLVSETLERVIQRADELNEFLAIYWKDGRQPLSAQVKKGLARAFRKFSEYDLAKWGGGEGSVKLRDVLFLSHAKPKNATQDKLWKKLINGELKTPDTWEVQLSAGKDKKKTWERLIKEEKLGALALLRNLRNMEGVSVDQKLIKEALSEMKVDRVLPFRFITAARYAPAYEPELEAALFKAVKGNGKLTGKTILIVDVSGSMGAHISGRSEISRLDAACSLAMLAREICQEVKIYATAGNDSTMVHSTALTPPRRGFALRDAVFKQQRTLGGGGIFLKQVLEYVKSKESEADRIIVLTDEQDCDHKPGGSPLKAEPFGDANYMINVGSDKNGIGYGMWTHIDGWSESVINYIITLEKSGN